MWSLEPVVSAVSFGLVMTLFTEPAERAKAMGIAGFVASGGGSIGVLLGGVLTGTLSWHWIFLVNVPIGILVFILSLRLLPEAPVHAISRSLDIGGAVTVTASLMLAVYGINGHPGGWRSATTIGLLIGAVVLFAVFVAWEMRVEAPLMPLRLFLHRNLSTANGVGILWAGAMFAWFFISSLYLQFVLGYKPLKVGLAFLPGNLIMGALSIGISAKLVMKYGYRKPLAAGLLLAAVGLGLLARAPVHGHFLQDVLPSMILLGLGAGIAFNPVLLAAMGDVEPQEAGIASGIVNTSFMMGGALGFAVLASIASSRTSSLQTAGHSASAALTGGYHAAFLGGTICAVLAAVVGVVLLHEAKAPGFAHGERLSAEPVFDAD